MMCLTISFPFGNLTKLLIFPTTVHGAQLPLKSTKNIRFHPIAGNFFVFRRETINFDDRTG